MTTSEERYQANLELIGKKNPELAKNISQMPITGIRLVPSPSDNEKIIGQIWDMENKVWLPLCDPNDPVGEAIKDVEGRENGQGLYLPDKKCFILLGMGNGYFAVEMAKRLKPWQKLAIFDTNPNCYKAAMYCIDMTPLLGNARVDTFIGDNLGPSLQNWWLSFSSHEKFHIAPPMRAGYTNQVDKEAYDSMLSQCLDMMRYHAVGLATWKQFGKEIGRNDFGNMPEFLANPGLERLKGLWHGKPAICLAAGPSLRKNLKTLMEAGVRDKVAILSVGTIYALLRALRFEPDLVTTIDFQRLNYTDQFQYIPLNPDTPLLYLHSTHPETPRRWPGPRFVALNSSDTVEWMRQFSEPKMPAAQVQTVAHLNLVAAIVMQASPIILMGQDLAMPRNEHHAPGARAQDTSPEDNMDAHVNAEDIYGNPCWTRHSFLSMRTVFTQLVQQNQGPEYLNCTEGGIHIDGFTDAPLQEVLNSIKEKIPSSPVRLSSVLKKTFDSYTPVANWEVLDKSFTSLLSDVRHLTEISESILNLARNRRQALKRGDEKEAHAFAKRILGKEPSYQERQVAFSLFAVRRFDMVELLSRIPLPDGTSQEDIDKEGVEKLVGIAKCFIEESPSVVFDLKMCMKRLEDIKPKNAKNAYGLKDILRMMARQSYHVAAQQLKKGPLPTDRNCKNVVTPVNAYLVDNIKVMSQAYSNLHLYEYANALLECYGLRSKKVMKNKNILDNFHTSHQEIVPKYYIGIESPTGVNDGD